MLFDRQNFLGIYLHHKSIKVQFEDAVLLLQQCEMENSLLVDPIRQGYVFGIQYCKIVYSVQSYNNGDRNVFLEGKDSIHIKIL